MKFCFVQPLHVALCHFKTSVCSGWLVEKNFPFLNNSKNQVKITCIWLVVMVVTVLNGTCFSFKLLTHLTDNSNSLSSLLDCI